MNQVCAAGALCWDAVILELVKGIPTALVALLIGGIAASIAWRQYKVAEGKFNLDLFKERYEVYDIARKFLDQCVEPNTTHLHSYEKEFLAVVPKAYFLFGKDVGGLMETVHEDFKVRTEIRTKIVHPTQKTPKTLSSAEEVVRINKNLTAIRRQLREVFSGYMDFGKWHGM